MPCGIDCCGVELISALVAGQQPITADTLRFTPQQSDILLVMGTITNKLAPAVVAAYETMPTPRRVIAVGACACSGGIYDNYNVVQGLDKLIPVDAFIPGCPPQPASFYEALAALNMKCNEEPYE